jgi:hypothetical protein
MDWIEYGKTWSDFWNENLNNAGTKIVVDDRELLIGDINELGGCCDCCRGVQRDAVITKYKPPD